MNALLRCALGTSLLVAACLPEPPSSAVSGLKPDERVVFFGTDAWQSADGRTWHIPIHAWVHELEKTRARKAIFAGVLERRYGLEATAATEPNFDRRVRLFTVDNERDKTVVIRIAGETFTLPPTAPNGHAHGELVLDAHVVARVAKNRTLSFTAVLPQGDARIFTGTANLVDPTGVSVISDIDDTVKVTEVRNRAAMFDRTFFRDFEPAAGMAALYRDWAGKGAMLHFVSSSPWHLFEPLDEFLTASGFPPRTLSLKLVRVKDRTFLDLFSEGTETKPRQIRPILERFPQRRFVLVGDSGEQDPEVYGALAREHPRQIERIYIRNVDGSDAGDERYQAAFESVDRARWSLFSDASSIELPR